MTESLTVRRRGELPTGPSIWLDLFVGIASYDELVKQENDGHQTFSKEQLVLSSEDVEAARRQTLV